MCLLFSRWGAADADPTYYDAAMESAEEIRRQAIASATDLIADLGLAILDGPAGQLDCGEYIAVMFDVPSAPTCDASPLCVHVVKATGHAYLPGEV